MEQLIEYMKSLGWYEAYGEINHDELQISSESWLAAIKDCIEVACDPTCAT